jgi:hypothetical protein
MMIFFNTKRENSYCGNNFDLVAYSLLEAVGSDKRLSFLRSLNNAT